MSRAAAMALMAALGAVPAAAQQESGAPAPAAEPRPLVFTGGADRYAVPADGYESIGFDARSGLQLCMIDPVEREIAAFTEAHVGELVRVAIGDTQITALEVVTPYAGGCIVWAVHPVVAANYIAMLTGEVPRTPVPSTGLGE